MLIDGSLCPRIFISTGEAREVIQHRWWRIGSRSLFWEEYREFHVAVVTLTRMLNLLQVAAPDFDISGLLELHGLIF